MSDKIVKLGVVGCGRGVSVFWGARGNKNVKLTAICDHNPEKLEGARRFLEDENGYKDIRCYLDVEEILKSDIDAIIIATDAIYHVPYVVKALEAGKHVLSEIPAVNSVEEAKQLKEAVNAHPKLIYMVGENCCYWAFIQSWKMMYDDGKFGEAVYAESEYIHSKDYREFKEEDYPKDYWRTFNPAIKYLTHNLGPLLYIMDDECVSVSCMVPDVIYNPYTIGPKNGVALFKTAKGAVIRILICFDAYAGFDHNFALIGTRGTIETDKTKPLETAHSFARFSDIPGTIEDKVEIPVTMQFYGEEGGGHGGADEKMTADFIKCIVENRKPALDVDMAIKISLPGVIAHESSMKGGELMEIPKI